MTPVVRLPVDAHGPSAHGLGALSARSRLVLATTAALWMGTAQPPVAADTVSKSPAQVVAPFGRSKAMSISLRFLHK
jgi:hypothetical protein